MVRELSGEMKRMVAISGPKIQNPEGCLILENAFNTPAKRIPSREVEVYGRQRIERFVSIYELPLTPRFPVASRPPVYQFCSPPLTATVYAP